MCGCARFLAPLLSGRGEDIADLIAEIDSLWTLQSRTKEPKSLETRTIQAIPMKT